MGTDEDNEIRAYKKWLTSNIPHMAGSVPGGAEIAKAADTYFEAHKSTGACLPFFNPFSIKELNLYSIVTERNFVVYKLATKIRTLKLNVVADTRMFSTARFDGPCFHVLLMSDGTGKRLTEKELRTSDITPMICEKKMKGAIKWRSPLELAKKIRPSLSSDNRKRMAKLGFLEIKYSGRKLDEFASVLERPVRLMGVDCTSQFRKQDPKNISPMWRIHATELAESMGPEKGEPIDVYLVAQGDVMFGVTEVSSSFIGIHSGGKIVVCASQKEVEDRVRSRKRKLEDEKKRMEETEGEDDDQNNGKRLRLTAHKRVDDCCNLEVGGEECEACKEATIGFEGMKKPPIESSHYMYNPNKFCSSLLSELKGLGLCIIFPDLEENLAKANLASIVALDIETLNVSVSDGCKSGTRCSSLRSGGQRGGVKTLSRHVLFMMGTAAFKIKSLDRWSRKGLLWRVTQEALRYNEFRVSTASGVPTQTEVHDCVSEWLDYMILRRKCVERYKRKLLEPIMMMLRKMREVSNGNTQKDQKGRAPPFACTIFGRVLGRLENLCEAVNVITYNGTR